MVGHIARFSEEISSLYKVTDRATFFEYIRNTIKCCPSVVSQRSLRAVDEAMSRDMYCFELDHKQVWIPRSAFGLAREIIARRIYEFDERFAISRGDRVMDLGANVGVFSVLAAKQGAEVVAVEAQSGLIDECTANLKVNLIDAVHLVHGIVAPSSGQFGSREARAAASHWERNPVEVDIYEVLRDRNWDCVNLLKSDIEGAEFQLFATSGDWIERVQRIAMEVHPEYGDVNELVDYLRRKRFETVVTDLNRRPVADLEGSMGYVYGVAR